MSSSLHRSLSNVLVSAACSALAAIAFCGVSRAAEVNTGYFGNVAVEGYDVVAYFTDSKAVRGSADISYEWLGATWLFSTEDHRDRFAAEPITYAPQFGGLCAEGMAYAEMTVNIEPEAWQIIDGKLYFTAGAHFVEDLQAIRERGEENWPGVHEEMTH